ncbi:MBL fold metallo-hydrolase [Lichenifustis flavocetrariae]|uniref:MBL fold metallo-hydrolase n=1 Tax=Lichenifustis flavocetrariae TaxID=2949735 RepID=A0AA41YT36_9HYPH|nr:MBL fold metallo-hydrolase [Lichenifustis flavocetrariae]MCW6506825.1 MBL fold metallo-hydrolase [Lichenifustis flavocetrariae]
MDILRWQRKRERVPWPRAVANQPFPPPPEATGPGEATITFIGHASYLIRVDGFTLLTDPIFSDRASPFAFAGPKRVRKPGLALDALPPIDAVLLSHNHYDHMDLPSLRALASRCRPTIVTGLGNGAYLSARGIGPSVELDWWERAEPKPGLVITYVPAQHWSSRSLLDRRRMLWGGHVIETASGRLYFAGDSGYFDGFREIRSRLGSPSVALLPIGAYEPRWFMQSQHMNPTEAVEAHVDLDAALSLATHWGTFQLTDEGIDAPLEALQTAKRERGLRQEAFQAPLPGQTIVARLERI